MMPTDGYMGFPFSKEIIGKDVGRELYFARREADNSRVSEILEVIRVNSAGERRQ
jgi:hypothetical protein